MSAFLTETTLELLQIPPVCLLTWQYGVNAEGVHDSFDRIKAYLDAAAAPLHVIINTLHSPNFPLMTAIQTALASFVNHPQLGHCIVVGTGGLARVFAKTLQDMSHSPNIYWTDTLKHALQQLS